MTMPSMIWALRYEKEIETCGGKALRIDTEWLTVPCGDAPAYIRSDIAEELARALERIARDRYESADALSFIADQALTCYLNAIDTATPSV